MHSVYGQGSWEDNVCSLFYCLSLPKHAALTSISNTYWLGQNIECFMQPLVLGMNLHYANLTGFGRYYCRITKLVPLTWRIILLLGQQLL